MFEILRRILIASIGLGLIAGNKDEIMEFFNNATEVSRKLATAGDMKTISDILDYNFIKKGRYPSEKYFKKWLRKSFKENNIKAINEDHWGNVYVYKTGKRNRSYTLISKGKDKILGTDDDLKATGP